MNYALLLFAAFLFSIQFVSLKYFQKIRGNTVFSVSYYCLISSVAFFLVAFMLNGFTVKFNSFSIILGIICGTVEFLCSVFGVKALGVTDLSVYSLFMMLGGMLLPFLFGIIYNGEDITVLKIISVILIASSMFLALDVKGGSKKIGLIFCFAIFIINGSIGIIQNLYSSNTEALGTFNFMCITNIVHVILGGTTFLIYTLTGKRLPKITAKKDNVLSLLSPLLHTVVHGTAIVILYEFTVEASVQYSLISGGTIFFSAIMGMLFKEKITVKTIIRIGLVIIGTVLMIF